MSLSPSVVSIIAIPPSLLSLVWVMDKFDSALCEKSGRMGGGDWSALWGRREGRKD